MTIRHVSSTKDMYSRFFLYVSSSACSPRILYKQDKGPLVVGASRGLHILDRSANIFSGNGFRRANWFTGTHEGTHGNWPRTFPGGV